MGHIQTFDDLISMLIRRRWWISLAAILGIAASAFYAKSLPDVYEARAVIQVQGPVVTETDSPASASAQVLQAIEQRLTARENMLAMMDRHGLFADLAALPDDKKVFLLRQSVTFQSVASAQAQSYGSPGGVSAIIITARLDNADQAARVANDFAQGVLDQGSAGQLQKARETLGFFQTEESRVWAEIVKLESEIAAYKTANRAALPGAGDTQRDTMVGLEVDLRELEQTLVGLEGDRARIESSEVQRATDRRQLETLNAQMSVTQAQIASLRARRAEQEAKQTATPEVASALSGYERRMDQLQDQYQGVTTRLAEAQTSLRLAEDQQTERFSLLERAVPPAFSSGSGGKKIAVLGAAASIVLALGLAFLLDVLNPVVRTAAQMERELDLMPVITIPEVRMNGSTKPQATTAKQGRNLMRVATVVCCALIVIVAAANLS